MPRNMEYLMKGNDMNKIVIATTEMSSMPYSCSWCKIQRQCPICLLHFEGGSNRRHKDCPLVEADPQGAFDTIYNLQKKLAEVYDEIDHLSIDQMDMAKEWFFEFKNRIDKIRNSP